MADRLISADALKDVLKNWRRTIDPYDGYWNGFNDAFHKSIEAIDNAPTIEAEPTDRINLQELEDRFGKYVRFVVEDMISGEGKRWEK